VPQAQVGVIQHRHAFLRLSTPPDLMTPREVSHGMSCASIRETGHPLLARLRCPPCAVQALQRFQRRRVAAAAACAAALLGLSSAAAAGVSLLSPLPPVLLLAAAGAAVAYCRRNALIAKFVFTDYDHAMQH